MTLSRLVMIVAIPATLLVLKINITTARLHHCASSISDLRELVQADFETTKRLKLLKDDPSTLPALSGVIRSYVESFLDSSLVRNLEDEGELVRHMSGTIENPLAILRLMQRVIQFLRDTAVIPERDSLREGLGRFSNVSHLEQEWDEVAAGLERIHSIYNLNVTEMGDVETGVRLHGRDCFLTGRLALRERAYSSAIKWFLEANNRLDKQDKTVDLVDLEVTYRHAVMKFKCSLNPAERFQFPVNEKLGNKKLKNEPKLCRDPGPSDLRPHKAVPITRRFSYYSVRGLQELIELERQIYEIVPPVTPAGSTPINLVAMNPLTIFQTLWRFEYVAKKMLLESAPAQPPGVDALVRAKLMKLYDPSDGPTVEDVHVAALGLLRTQYIYALRTEDVSRGMLAGTETGVPLNPAQCIKLAQRAAYHDYHALAVGWAEEALRKVKQEGTNNNTYYNAVELLTLAENEVEIAKRMLKLNIMQIRGTESREGSTRTRYRRICQGRISQNQKEKQRLFCWLESKIHPTWVIGPLKAEWLSLTPQVVQYHEVITEGFIQLVLQARQFLKGTTVKPHRGNVIDTNRKLSAVSPVPHVGGPEAKNDTATLFWGLVKRVTGKRSDRKSVMQVASYAPGGHYSVHDDTIGESTFLAYLTQPEKGGETVMLEPGLRIPPKRGSAIHWHNLDGSGEKDLQTLHASCPIIFGVKQIAIAWPLYSKQSHLVCREERKRKIDILVNGRSMNN